MQYKKNLLIEILKFSIFDQFNCFPLKSELKYSLNKKEIHIKQILKILYNLLSLYAN